MIKLKYILNEEKVRKGLYQAKVGDPIWIGIEGNRAKHYSKIEKILNDKLIDTEGNIFAKDGRLIKGGQSRFMKKFNKGKTISAKLITQKEFDKQFKNIKIEFLRKFDYDKLNIDDILKIIDAFPNHTQGNTLNISRFEK